jgi:RNA polymerase sigma-70 factor (ECF subfamily)
MAGFLLPVLVIGGLVWTMLARSRGGNKIMQFGKSRAKLVSKESPNAFSMLYADTCTRRFGLIRRVLVDFSQSEEVTEEAYVEVWQLGDRCDPELGSATSWMFPPERRRAIDRVRASHASRVRDLKVGIRDRVDLFDEVPAAVETTMQHERATRCLKVLTPIQRETLTLDYWEGLTITELAEKVGMVSVATVNSRLRDGLIRLRAEMDNEERPTSPERIP